MRVVLSRKGFDSGYGGYPSPIMPDGEMLSMPIPVNSDDIKYNELRVNESLTYSDVMGMLYGDSIKVAKNGRLPLDEISCHLDPDLRRGSYSRDNDWRGIFGQAGGSQSHLENQGVGIGDLFLYFGWFRETEWVDGKLRFVKGSKGFQAIYGYMQVDEMHKVNACKTKVWMKTHPHVKRGAAAKDNDYVYIGREKLSIDDSLVGYGTFKYHERLFD